MTVSEVMHRDVPAVDEDMPYKDVVRNLAAWHVPAVVVIDRTGHVIGLVSASDLVLRPAGRHRHGSRLPVWRNRSRLHKAQAATAAALMTRPVVHVPPDTPLVEAARVATEAGVRELAVLDLDGHILGMVDRADLLADYLRSDEEIREDIIANLLLERFCIDPASVEIAVRDGVVSLAGCLDTQPLCGFLVDAVRDVPGVVDVANRLTAHHPH